jgi:hypothetical protein
MLNATSRQPRAERHFFTTKDARKGVISITSQDDSFYEWIVICGPISRRGGATERDDAFEDAMLWAGAELGGLAKGMTT